jgi:elongation factor G
MKREFNVEANIGQPQVAYRETIRKDAVEIKVNLLNNLVDVDNTVTYGCDYQPNEAGKGFEFINSIKGGSVPSEYIKPVSEGIKEAMNNGVLAGYPVVDVKAELYDGSYHDVDSNEMAFKIAGSYGASSRCESSKSSAYGTCHESSCCNSRRIHG